MGIVSEAIDPDFSARELGPGEGTRTPEPRHRHLRITILGPLPLHFGFRFVELRGLQREGRGAFVVSEIDPHWV